MIAVIGVGNVCLTFIEGRGGVLPLAMLLRYEYEDSEKDRLIYLEEGRVNTRLSTKGEMS